MYADDDLLSLSGIQHFAFCPRQWALTHVDRQWHDNYLTIEGTWLHRVVDEPFNMDSDYGTVHLRSVAVKSYALGLYGIADLLELTPLTNAEAKPFTVPRYPGRWEVHPVEYKHGKPKPDDADEVQLCAQAMCLEEMYGISISYGAIYYGKTRRRCQVSFNEAMRTRVGQLASQMHAFIDQGVVPDAAPRRQCMSCSLADLCMVPDLSRATPVNNYLKQLSQ